MARELYPAKRKIQIQHLLACLGSIFLLFSKPLSAQNTPGPATLESLQEKTYLHTDKPYYYPGERIWIKSYMNYRSWPLMDSLSHVLYIELISDNQKIILTKVLKIENGVASGSIDVGDEITPGNYFLRSYTNWMLNFSDGELFLKPVPILALEDKPKPASGSNEIPDTVRYPRLSIIADKPSYHPRDKVVLEIEVRDEDDNPLQVNASISVTDAEQVISVSDQPSILETYPFRLKEHSPSKPVYAIEGGITLQGIYKDKKGNPVAQRLVVAEEKSNQIAGVDAEQDGSFFVTGFQFHDSVTIGFDIIEKKAKAVGRIELTPRVVPPVTSLPDPLPLVISKTTTKQARKPYANGSEKVIVLAPVTIKSTPQESDESRVYGHSDYAVSGEALNDLNSTSILDGLQVKIPGMTFIGRTVRLGASSSFSSLEPLLIIDGQPMNGSPGSQSIDAILGYLVPRQIEKIEVIKFGGAALYGVRGANGVIVVTTKKTDYSKPAPKPTGLGLKHFQTVRVRGYDQPLEFKIPDYSKSPNTDSTDIRSTVYWNPEVSIPEFTGKSSVSFYSADLPTRYRIIVEGVTASGIPVRNIAYITISK